MKKICILLVGLFCLGTILVKAQYKVLFNFNGRNGAMPSGSLVLSENKLFGTTFNGGLTNNGIIFGIDTNATGYIDSNDLHDFSGTSGWAPYGSVIRSGSKLYGMTSLGGTPGEGNVFSMDTDGSAYQDIFDFNGTNGYWPYTNLISVGSKLYGMTVYGGIYDSGCIFSMDTNGSGYQDLHDFVSAAQGELPNGSLDYSQGKLYGVANGGAFGYGNVFSLDTNGTDYRVIFNFNDTDGYAPNGTFVISGQKLYGMTEWGGADYSGCIFSLDTNGTGYEDLHNFTPSSGANPFGSLTLAGNLLYGMTYDGGVNGGGNIFFLDTNGSGYQDLFDFADTTGSGPEGVLTVSGNTLYGTTFSGGANYDGVVFSFKICTNNYTEPICIATVDTATNKAEIIWGRTNSPPSGGFGSYNIYKDTLSSFTFIHSQPLDSLSEYIDTTSFPGDGPESYELATTDSCGQSALSATHTTIYLTTTSGINVYILNWTAYIGFTPTEYRIFRGPSMSSLVQIDSVPSTTLTYHDTLPPAGSLYLIEAVSPFGVCVPTTHRPGHPSISLSGSYSNGYNAGALVTGINKWTIENGQLKIYPNPSNGLITLSYSSLESENVQINIINELGQIVYKENIPATIGTLGTKGTITEQLNLSNLASGIYTLRMESNSGSMVKKLVVMGR